VPRLRAIAVVVGRDADQCVVVVVGDEAVRDGRGGLLAGDRGVGELRDGRG